MKETEREREREREREGVEEELGSPQKFHELSQQPLQITSRCVKAVLNVCHRSDHFALCCRID